MFGKVISYSKKPLPVPFIFLLSNTDHDFFDQLEFENESGSKLNKSKSFNFSFELISKCMKFLCKTSPSRVFSVRLSFAKPLDSGIFKFIELMDSFFHGLYLKFTLPEVILYSCAIKLVCFSS